MHKIVINCGGALLITKRCRIYYIIQHEDTTVQITVFNYFEDKLKFTKKITP